MGKPRKSDNPDDYYTDAKGRLRPQKRYIDRTIKERNRQLRERKEKERKELDVKAVGFGFENASAMLTAIMKDEVVALTGASVNEAAVNALNRHIDAGGFIAFDSAGHLVVVR